MLKTFTYIGDHSTALDYARWRLNDVDPQAWVDETQAPSPFLWDDTYLALFAKWGVHYGMVLAARTIALKLSTDITSFGEAAGIRVAWANKDYYEQLADEIANEPAFNVGGNPDDSASSGAVAGKLSRGNTDTRNFREFMNPPPSYPLGRGVR